MGYRVSAAYIDEIGLLNPVEWAAGFPGPIYFVQGAEDSIVKPDQVDCYLHGRNNSQDRLLLISDGDHFFGSPESIDSVINESTKWLMQRLKLV